MNFAFTNYGVSIGLQAVDATPDRVAARHAFFDRYRAGDEYDERRYARDGLFRASSRSSAMRRRRHKKAHHWVGFGWGCEASFRQPSL